MTYRINKSIPIHILLLFFLTLEFLSYSTFYRLFPLVNPWLQLISSFGFSYIIYYMRQSNKTISIPITLSKVQESILIGIIIITIGFIIYWINCLFIEIPNNYKHSDVVPSIEALAHRFCMGQNPYYPINFGDFTDIPSYLPFKWLPFLFSELLKIDPRWTSVFFFFVIIGYMYVYYRNKLEYNGFNTIIALLAIGHFVATISAMKDQFALSSEYMIVVCYMLLAFQLQFSYSVKTAIFIVICMTSRYSFLFWLPIYFFVQLVHSSRKQFIVQSITILGFLTIVLLPFVWGHEKFFITDFLIFKTNFMLSLWKIGYWQQNGEIPFHLNHGFGFMIYYYKFMPGTLLVKYTMAKYGQLIIWSLYSIAAIIFYWTKRHTILDMQLFLIITLKLSLALFVLFITSPFPYLFFPIFYVDIIMLYYITKKK